MQFLSTKYISGIKYYYLQYQGYSKSLGTQMPLDMKLQVKDFFISIGEKQQHLCDTVLRELFLYGNIHQVEPLHYQFTCLVKNDAFIEEYHYFMKYFALQFTYNSNRAEGSRTTQSQVQKVLFDTPKKPQTKTEREVMNSYEALLYAFSNQMNFAPSHIKRIHTLLLDNLEDPLIVGKWKKESNVAPGNQMTIAPVDISAAMKSLIQQYSVAKKQKLHPLQIAMDFYASFEHIHPFADGNGRVGRILFNAILNKAGYHPIVFHSDNHQTHCEALTQYIAGRKTKFAKHVLEQLEKTHTALPLFDLVPKR